MTNSLCRMTMTKYIRMSLTRILKSLSYNALNVEVFDLRDHGRLIHVPQKSLIFLNKDQQVYIFTKDSTTYVGDSTKIMSSTEEFKINYNKIIINRKNMKLITISTDHRKFNLYDTINLLLKKGICTIK